MINQNTGQPWRFAIFQLITSVSNWQSLNVLVEDWCGQSKYCISSYISKVSLLFWFKIYILMIITKDHGKTYRFHKSLFKSHSSPTYRALFDNTSHHPYHPYQPPIHPIYDPLHQPALPYTNHTHTPHSHQNSLFTLITNRATHRQ